MNPFLDNYLFTLTKRKQEHVGTLMQEAVVGKDQLGVIASRLSSFTGFSNVNLQQEAALNVISSNRMKMNLRDVWLQMQELFNISLLISTMISSSSAIYSSQVKAVEDQIIALEKLTNNYAFLLSEGGAFNFAYLETFSDERNRDAFNFAIPDRAGLSFGDAQQAIVDSTLGVLTLTDVSLGNSYPLTGALVGSNVSTLVKSDNGLNKALNTIASDGWRYVVGSQCPVTSSLDGVPMNAGAQVLLEFNLPQASPACQIKLVPLADQPIQILSLRIFVNPEDMIGQETLTFVRTLNGPITIHFPLQFVDRFRILVNQPTYVRTFVQGTNGEKQYTLLQQPTVTPIGKKINSSAQYKRLLAYVHTYDLVKTSLGSSSKSLPTFDSTWKNLRLDQLAAMSKNTLAGSSANLFQYDSKDESLLRMFWNQSRQWAQPYSTNDISTTVRQNDNTNIQLPQSVHITDPIIVMPTNTFDQNTVGYEYDYTLGFKYVAIGIDSEMFKGVHVSKPLQSNGDIGQVRLKTSETNFTLPSGERDSNIVTSTEYSVSNVSTPNREQDWIPILPIGQTYVQAERFYLDVTGKGFFRFAAIPGNNLILYKNGYRFQLDAALSFIYSANKETVLGINTPHGTYSSSDVFTVDYFPAGDGTLVDFAGSGFTLPPLVAAHDSTGAGESFAATLDSNTVTLLWEPYVDYNQVAASAYTLTTGLTPYQPITVTLTNGTTATNLTNYTSSVLNNATSTLTPVLPDPTVGVYYYQSGEVLIFNQALTSPFKVFYQYLENTIRVRTILRVNYTSFVSPSVDFWHLKGKTRRPDPKAELG